MFFILGFTRSGTTMLRYVLSEHPQAVVFPETQFIPELVARTRRHHIDPRTPDGQQRIIEAMLRTDFVTRSVSRYPMEAAALERRIREPTLGGCISTLFDELAERVNKPVWGIKTPYYTSHLPLLAEVFPEARFVYLVRDGRDVTMSAERIWRKNLLQSMLSWSRTCRKVQADLAHPALRSRTLTVRFEDLLSDPRARLQEIAAHLGLDWDERLLTSSGESAHWWSAEPMSARREPPRLIEPGNAHKWRTRLPAAAQWAFDRFCGQTLLDHGYELAGVRLPAAERAAVTAHVARFRVRELLPARSIHPRTWLARWRKWTAPL